MQHRGTARRRPVVVRGGDLAPGTAITAGDKPVGAIGSAQGDLGVAIVRLDRAQEARDAGVPLMAAGAPVEIALPSWAGFDWPTDGGGET
jgi:folate-binding Fe-S cluster repair protein YgfZ